MAGSVTTPIEDPARKGRMTADSVHELTKCPYPLLDYRGIFPPIKGSQAPQPAGNEHRVCLLVLSCTDQIGRHPVQAQYSLGRGNKPDRETCLINMIQCPYETIEIAHRRPSGTN